MLEHRDLDGKHGDNQGYTDHKNEFIHIRYSTKRGFYIWDPMQKTKHTSIPMGHFGMIKIGMVVMSNNEQEYGLRIDCVFTDKFRKQIGRSFA